jgi:GNAT superfamily N-acetyltransferase
VGATLAGGAHLEAQESCVNVSIRRARPSDAAAIANLTAQLGYDVDAAAVSGRLARLLPRADHYLLVADLAGSPIGWLHAATSEYIEADKFVLIGGLVVDRDHRRMGIGRLLMEAAERWATAQDCSIVRLWSSSVRAAAHDFYEQLGYVNVKTQYSFVKSLDGDSSHFEQFMPRVDADPPGKR